MIVLLVLCRLRRPGVRSRGSMRWIIREAAMARVVKFLKDQAPDVFGLYEVDGTPSR